MEGIKVEHLFWISSKLVCSCSYSELSKGWEPKVRMIKSSECPEAMNRDATSVFRDGGFLAGKIMVGDVLAGTQKECSVLWQKLVGPASTESHITAVTLHVWLTGFLKTELNSPWPVLPSLSSRNIYVAASRPIFCSRGSLSAGSLSWGAALHPNSSSCTRGRRVPMLRALQAR